MNIQDSRSALNGQCIAKNVVMYICGASVDCGLMMQYAIDALHQITGVLEKEVKGRVHQDLSSLYFPLTDALRQMYGQYRVDNVVRPLRVAMARLLDCCLVYLMGNEGFRAIFEHQWYPWLWTNLMRDNGVFLETGELGALPQIV